MLHPETYFDLLRDFFHACMAGLDDIIAVMINATRSLGRWRVVLASKLPEATSVQTVLARKLYTRVYTTYALVCVRLAVVVARLGAGQESRY